MIATGIYMCFDRHAMFQTCLDEKQRILNGNELIRDGVPYKGARSFLVNLRFETEPVEKTAGIVCLSKQGLETILMPIFS